MKEIFGLPVVCIRQCYVTWQSWHELMTHETPWIYSSGTVQAWSVVMASPHVMQTVRCTSKQFTGVTLSIWQQATQTISSDGNRSQQVSQANRKDKIWMPVERGDRVGILIQSTNNLWFGPVLSFSTESRDKHDIYMISEIREQLPELHWGSLHVLLERTKSGKCCHPLADNARYIQIWTETWKQPRIRI